MRIDESTIQESILDDMKIGEVILKNENKRRKTWQFDDFRDSIIKLILVQAEWEPISYELSHDARLKRAEIRLINE